MVTTYATTKIKDLPALAKAHQYVLKGRLSLQGRKRALASRGQEFGLDWLIETFSKLEVDLEKVIEDAYKQHILYPELEHIKGVGTELGPKLIGYIEAVERWYCTNCGTAWVLDKEKKELVPACQCKDILEGKQAGYRVVSGIACFDTLSRFWTFCGWGLPGKKTAGEKLNYNPELKSHLYKIAVSFMRSGNKFYEQVYISRKEMEIGKFDSVVPARRGEVKNLPPGVTTNIHIHERTLRVMIKVFLGCLYYRWRELLDLPRRITYAEEKLGHTGRYKLEDFWDR